MGSGSDRLVAKVGAYIVVALFFPVLVPGAVRADDAADKRIAELENRTERLQKRIENLPSPVEQHGPDGAAMFLFGAFCALWAQNTNRNAWAWFFLGLFFSVITVLVLLAKNSEDRKRRWNPLAGDFGS
jgi:hypothetical protein